MSALDRFVTDTLHRAGERMLLHQSWAIEDAYKEQTGRLMRDRRVVVNGSEFIFTHPIYERFLDLKRRGKRKDIGKIHNRFVYGTWSHITEELMYGFTEEVKEQFRKLDEEG